MKAWFPSKTKTPHLGDWKQNNRRFEVNNLILSWRMPLSYRNQSIHLHSKWFLYDRYRSHERVLKRLLQLKNYNFWKCSLWVLVSEYRVLVFYTIPASSKLCRPIGIVMGTIFRKNFAWFGELGPNFKPFLIYQPTVINKNQL